MTPEQLKKAGIALYGETGWKDKLAEALQVDGSTVRRWSSGAVSIPGPAAAAIACFLRWKRSRSRG